MLSFNNTHTITEYGSFTRGKVIEGYHLLPVKTFDALEAFILANNTNTETEAVELLAISVRRNVGKIITARNYVGLVTMKDGTVIQILPKIASGHITETETKSIFMEMVKTLKEVNFKDFDSSSLDTEYMNLFEIFIRMFLDEVTILTKQGLKSSYIQVENNEKFYRGKLLFSENIRYNIVNKERFYVSFDDFNINRPENRLLRATLNLIINISSDTQNRKQAVHLLAFFDGVQNSVSYDSDFSKCSKDRSMSHYVKSLTWCQIFLRGNSFTSFTGSKVAIALLFPMEKLFENYIAAKIRMQLGSEMKLWIQDTRYSLFDKPIRTFILRPDIVIDFSGHTVVIDTKWKLLAEGSRNKGISQSDMYQMYAYSKKYKADEVIMLYPLSDMVPNTDLTYSSDDNEIIKISFIDLKNIDDSISNFKKNLFAKK